MAAFWRWFALPALLSLASIGILTAKAGSLTPSSGTAASGYTLTDIYNRLNTNATATEGNHDLTTSAAPAGTFKTLKEIYDKIPTIDATKILSGTSYLGVDGTIATRTLSADSTTVSAGYYAATDLATVDSDLAAGNIKTGTTVFGIVGEASSGGTDLSDMFNGTFDSFTGGSQANGGADDYAAGGAKPADTYNATWTQCAAGNDWCGTDTDDDANNNEAGADAKDENTGLIWSLPCNGVGCAALSDAGAADYSWDNSAGNNNSKTASQLCSAGAHGVAGWFLPHQKQLMQVHIDGSYGNLETAGVIRDYWSATTLSNYTSYAWYTNLSNGYTNVDGKNGTYYVRCVR